MNDVLLGYAIGTGCIAFIALLAMIREVLLKKERDRWREQFERRNRDNGEWL